MRISDTPIAIALRVYCGPKLAEAAALQGRTPAYLAACQITLIFGKKFFDDRNARPMVPTPGVDRASKNV